MKTLPTHTEHQTGGRSSALHAPRVSFRRNGGGYILFELVLALTIFAIAVLGLAKSLNQALETANLLRRDQIIRIGMRSFLEEIRNKPIAQMSTSKMDTTYGISYTSTTDTVSLKTTNGSVLSDMYNLTIRATSSFDGVPQEDTLSVYVYKPAQK
jgi:Tfp pilus assembly protein PilV